MTPGLLLGWSCSFALGLAIWFALAGWPRRGSEWLTAAGYAVLLGFLATGLLVGLKRETVGASLFTAVLPLLLTATVLSAGIAFWRQRGRLPVAVAPLPTSPLPRWLWLLLIPIALRFAYVLDEAVLRPVFVWDAWNAWSLKAKTWFELGQVPFVDAPAWWQRSDTAVHTALAWRYPELLSRVELWFAAAAGAWNEGAVAAAWPLLWLALIAGCAGQWRALGVTPARCLVFAYLLASLPLLSVHAGLAGYADLWVAAALSFAVLSWLRWLQTRETGQLALAVVCAALLSLLKFEGAVWALWLAGLALFVALPRRLRWLGLASAALLLLAAVLLSLLLQLPWLAFVRDTVSGLTASNSETARLGAALAFVNGLFSQYNWHLLWPLLAGCLIWQRERLWRERETGLLAVLIGGGLFALFALFVFTPAAKWAASQTAASRLMLHWAPLALSLVALLLRDRPEPPRIPDASPP
ncbi:MAG TPA: hypothetical protein VM847_11105 [Tahibacter sp.]|nr:hypothetical protein [Tahibacter sp.]